MRNYDPFQKQAGPACRMLRAHHSCALDAARLVLHRLARGSCNIQLFGQLSGRNSTMEQAPSCSDLSSVSGGTIIYGAVNSVTPTVQGTHDHTLGASPPALRSSDGMLPAPLHTIINRVGRSFSGFGDSSDLGGPYVFSDAAGSTFWTAAGAAGAAAAVPAGSYRTTSANFNTATSILSTFGFPAGVTGTNINGTWTVTISDVATPDGGSITAAMVLTVDYTPPPANDACANAINVTTYPYTSASISNASASDDSPVVGGPYTCNTSGSGGPYKNIWWRVTGICGTMTANLCGCDFDTEMAVPVNPAVPGSTSFYASCVPPGSACTGARTQAVFTVAAQPAATAGGSPSAHWVHHCLEAASHRLEHGDNGQYHGQLRIYPTATSHTRAVCGAHPSAGR